MKKSSLGTPKIVSTAVASQNEHSGVSHEGLDFRKEPNPTRSRILDNEEPTMLKLMPSQGHSKLDLVSFTTLSHKKFKPTMRVVDIPIQYGPNGTRHSHDQQQG